MEELEATRAGAGTRMSNGERSDRRVANGGKGAHGARKSLDKGWLGDGAQ